MLPPLGRVGQQRQLLQLRPPCRCPQLLLLLHAVAQRHGLQLVLGAGSRLHLLVPMHQQLPHVALFQTRHPDLGKLPRQQQIKNMRRIPPVGLLLAHHLGSNPGGIAQLQFETQLCQQTLEPGIVPASFHPHSHRLTAQRPVERLRFFPMGQPFFFYLSRSVVKDRDLLKSRMKITAYNQHDVGSFSRALVCSSQPIYSLRRANVVMQSSAARG